jgi:hypothetical protein
VARHTDPPCVVLWFCLAVLILQLTGHKDQFNWKFVIAVTERRGT